MQAAPSVSTRSACECTECDGTGWRAGGCWLPLALAPVQLTGTGCMAGCCGRPRVVLRAALLQALPAMPLPLQVRHAETARR